MIYIKLMTVSVTTTGPRSKAETAKQREEVWGRPGNGKGGKKEREKGVARDTNNCDSCVDMESWALTGRFQAGMQNRSVRQWLVLRSNITGRAKALHTTAAQFLTSALILSSFLKSTTRRLKNTDFPFLSHLCLWLAWTRNDTPLVTILDWLVMQCNKTPEHTVFLAFSFLQILVSYKR